MRIAYPALLLVVAAAPAAAEPEARIGTVGLTIENDLFSDTDRHYTNGLRLTFLTTPDAVPRWVTAAATALPFFPDEGEMRASFALGQNMFTPADITRASPGPDDRPYAGWLYAAVGLVADTGDRLDRVELSVGVVGPSAHAAEAQTLVHSITGSPEPKGWSTQLDDEPAVLLQWQRAWRETIVADLAGFSLDATPHVGAALGNVYTYAAAGGMLRFGHDLPHDYGPPRIQPALPGSGFFVASEGFGWYLFAGTEIRLVARDIFLDGNTVGGSTGIDRIPLVADLQAGLAVAWGPVRLAYTHVLRSPEFAEQSGLDQFGAVSVSVRY